MVTPTHHLPDSAVAVAVRPKATTRPVWLLSYAAMVALAVIRLPALAAQLRTQVPAELSDGVDDDQMVALAVGVGVGLAGLVVAGFYALLLAAAALLDRTLALAPAPLPRGNRIGLLFSAVVATSLAAHGWAVTVSAGETTLPVGSYALAVGALTAVLWARRQALRALPPGRRVLALCALGVLCVVPLAR